MIKGGGGEQSEKIYYSEGLGQRLLQWGDFDIPMAKHIVEVLQYLPILTTACLMMDLSGAVGDRILGWSRKTGCILLLNIID